MEAHTIVFARLMNRSANVEIMAGCLLALEEKYMRKEGPSVTRQPIRGLSFGQIVSSLTQDFRDQLRCWNHFRAGDN